MSEDKLRRLMIHIHERSATAQDMASQVHSRVWPHRSDRALLRSAAWNGLCDDAEELSLAINDIEVDLAEVQKLKAAYDKETSCEPTA